jgi:hexosaminidase
VWFRRFSKLPTQFTFAYSNHFLVPAVRVSHPTPQVVDAPRFLWRGVLVDVGRHFFPVPFILKLLDLMALYKMNRFHWHLTEDQVR